MREAVLAVDVGGTKTAVALADRELVVSAVRSALAPGADRPQTILATVRDLARDLLGEVGDLTVRAVGAGTAGAVVARGAIISSTDTPANRSGTVAADLLELDGES